MELYCKATSNFPPGLGLTTFEVLGPEWEAELVQLPFGEEGRILPVVGWTDLFTGRTCRVHVAQVRAANGAEGYLIWGGNSGVRVLDDGAEVEEWESHLPPGWGLPWVWVEDPADLPEEVLEALAQRQEAA